MSSMYEDLEDSAQKGKDTADKGADIAANKIEDVLKNKQNANLNSNNLKKPDTKKATDSAKKATDATKKAEDMAGKAGAATEKAGKAAEKAADIGEAGASGLDAASGDVGGMAQKGIEKVGNGAKKMIGGKTNDFDKSKAGGDIAQNVENTVKDAAQGAVDTGVGAARIAASAGTDIGGWIQAIKGVLKLLGIILGIPIFLIVIISVIMPNMISAAIAKFTEAFSQMADDLIGTAYESFTMEDQYEILANAFGDEVFRAYELLLEDVEAEIDNYAAQPTYNEWAQLLKYNKDIGRIDYETVNSSTDVNEGLEHGMPRDVDVYIGGYVGPLTTEWGVNNVGSTTHIPSTLFNKGLYKEGKTESDADRYATGMEPYFDELEVKETVQAALGYAAVSDMAYLVSGYNVAMMEAPILEMGEKVNNLEAGITVVKYKLDIAVRIFSNTVDNEAEKYGGGIWGNIIAQVTTLGEFMGNKIAEVLNNETTFFAYDKDLIVVNTDTAYRTAFVYDEVINTVQEKTFKYTISWEKKESYYCSPCSSHTSPKKHTRTTSGTSDTSYTPSHSDWVSACSHNGYTPLSPDRYLDRAKNAWASSHSGYTITGISYSSSENYGSPYEINSSAYVEKQLPYNHNTLDIPMSAFDVDRILKAIFETSMYYGEMTWYYTDHDSSNKTLGKKIQDEDHIINKYGKYIDEWKYCYADKTITYDNGLVVDYVTGETYDNGIDQQPYPTQNMVFYYGCDCDPGYGILDRCPACGKKSFDTSNEIKDSSKSFVGEGNRTLYYLGTQLVLNNVYFIAVNDKFDATLEEMRQWYKDELRDVKQETSVMMTTTGKEVIDDYTGEQIGGNYQDSRWGSVVLTDEFGNPYYPITVLDRILSNKDTILNVLENSEKIQAELAKRGLTYSEKYIDGDINISPVKEYIANLIKDTSAYTKIEVTSDGKYRIGIGSWSGSSAVSLIDQIITNNPDFAEKLCTDNGIELSDFKSKWTNPNDSNAATYKKILEELLNAGKSEQDTMYVNKVGEVVDALRGSGISNSASLALFTKVAMTFEDISKLNSGGGLIGSFKEFVLMPSIRAGDADAFETGYQELIKWLNGKGKSIANSAKISDIEAIYQQLLIDIENDTIPWSGTGVLTPENVKPILDIAFTMTTSPYKEKFTYSQSGRYAISRFADAIETLYSTGNGYIVGDCSSFVAALYYKFGYSVPTSSAAWLNSNYRTRTDWENLTPGDVIVYRSSSGGHVEIYIGDGKYGENTSVGFGSAPPKEHNYKSAFTSYPRMYFYRVVE